jgi:hypothetical protein
MTFGACEYLVGHTGGDDRSTQGHRGFALEAAL